LSRLKPTINETLCTDPGTRDAATQEEYERHFYSRLKLPSGVYKTTHERRFDDVNNTLNELLPRGRPVRALDVGVSSGISTIEWLAALNSAGIVVHIVGGDLDITGYLIWVGTWLNILVDRTGYLLQVDIGSRSITNHRRFPIWRHIAYALPALFVNVAFKIFWLLNPALRRHIAAGGGEFTSRRGVRCRPLSLLSPRVRPNASVELVEDDIVAGTRRFDREFDVIRAANVLNFYLDPRMLKRMLDTLRSRLCVGGLLVICRTDMREQNLGTIFRLTNDRSLEVVRRIGSGSEIESFVLAGGDPVALNGR
jgi:hypothetical protein